MDERELLDLYADVKAERDEAKKERDRYMDQCHDLCGQNTLLHKEIDRLQKQLEQIEKIDSAAAALEKA